MALSFYKVAPELAQAKDQQAGPPVVQETDATITDSQGNQAITLALSNTFVTTPTTLKAGNETITLTTYKTEKQCNNVYKFTFFIAEKTGENSYKKTQQEAFIYVDTASENNGQFVIFMKREGSIYNVEGKLQPTTFDAYTACGQVTVMDFAEQPVTAQPAAVPSALAAQPAAAATAATPQALDNLQLANMIEALATFNPKGAAVVRVKIMRAERAGTFNNTAAVEWIYDEFITGQVELLKKIPGKEKQASILNVRQMRLDRANLPDAYRLAAKRQLIEELSFELVPSQLEELKPLDPRKASVIQVRQMRQTREGKSDNFGLFLDIAMAKAAAEKSKEQEKQPSK